MKVLFLSLTLFIAAPFVKGTKDDLYFTVNDNQESNNKSIRGTPIDDDKSGHQKYTNNNRPRPVVTKGGTSNSDYDKIFLDDISHCLPILKGEPLEDEEESSDGNVGHRKLQSMSSDYVLLCRHSDCTGGHVYAGPGYYPYMPWEIGNDELTRVYIPAQFSFQYFEDHYYGGWSETFGDPEYSIDLDMGGHNDAVSSFIIRRWG
jgi:hypothetical protein